MADRRDELCELIGRHAREPGRTPSPLPGLRFNRAERPGAFSPSKTPQLLLAVVAQGAKVCRIGAREYRYDSETYLVFTGETEFTSSVVEASGDRPYLSMSLQLPSEDIVRTLLSLGERPTREPDEDGESPAFSARVEPPLVDALCRLVATLDDPAERQVVAPLILSELVFRLLRSEAASTIRHAACQHGDQARIGQAMTFMRTHLARRLSVAAIARHVAMSPSHFAHRFREVARTSPMHYLKQVRLHAARLSLLQDGRSPAEVAAQVGYQSAAHFSRDFKSYFALPPATYVRQFRDAGVGVRSQNPATRSQAASSSLARA
jgi:AraC-like DNA-binding protein